MRITPLWSAFNLFRLVAVVFTIAALVATFIGLANDLDAYTRYQNGQSGSGPSRVGGVPEANYGLSGTPQSMGGVVFTVVSKFMMMIILPVLTISQLGAPEQLLFRRLPVFGPQSSPLALGLLQSAVGIENLRVYLKPPIGIAYVGLFVVGCLNILISMIIYIRAIRLHLPKSPSPALRFSLATRLCFWRPLPRCYFELFLQGDTGSVPTVPAFTAVTAVAKDNNANNNDEAHHTKRVMDHAPTGSQRLLNGVDGAEKGLGLESRGSGRGQHQSQGQVWNAIAPPGSRSHSLGALASASAAIVAPSLTHHENGPVPSREASRTERKGKKHKHKPAPMKLVDPAQVSKKNGHSRHDVVQPPAQIHPHAHPAGHETRYQHAGDKVCDDTQASGKPIASRRGRKKSEDDAYSGVVSLRSSIDDGDGRAVKAIPDEPVPTINPELVRSQDAIQSTGQKVENAMQGQQKGSGGSTASRRKAVPGGLVIASDNSNGNSDLAGVKPVRKSSTNQVHLQPPEHRPKPPDRRDVTAAASIEIPQHSKIDTTSISRSISLGSELAYSRDDSSVTSSLPDTNQLGINHDAAHPPAAVKDLIQPVRGEKSARRKTALIQSTLLNVRESHESESARANRPMIKKKEDIGQQWQEERESVVLASTDLTAQFPLPPKRKGSSPPSGSGPGLASKGDLSRQISTYEKDHGDSGSCQVELKEMGSKLQESTKPDLAARPTSSLMVTIASPAKSKSKSKTKTEPRQIVHLDEALPTSTSPTSFLTSPISSCSDPAPISRIQRKSLPPTLPLYSPFSPFADPSYPNVHTHFRESTAPAPAPVPSPLQTPLSRSKSHPLPKPITATSAPTGLPRLHTLPLRSSMAIKRSDTTGAGCVAGLRARAGLGVRFDSDLEKRFSAATQSSGLSSDSGMGPVWGFVGGEEESADDGYRDRDRAQTRRSSTAQTGPLAGAAEFGSDNRNGVINSNNTAAPLGLIRKYSSSGERSGSRVNLTIIPPSHHNVSTGMLSISTVGSGPGLALGQERPRPASVPFSNSDSDEELRSQHGDREHREDDDDDDGMGAKRVSSGRTAGVSATGSSAGGNGSISGMSATSISLSRSGSLGGGSTSEMEVELSVDESDSDSDGDDNDDYIDINKNEQGLVEDVDWWYDKRRVGGPVRGEIAKEVEGEDDEELMASIEAQLEQKTGNTSSSEGKGGFKVSDTRKESFSTSSLNGLASSTTTTSSSTTALSETSLAEIKAVKRISSVARRKSRIRGQAGDEALIGRGDRAIGVAA